MKDGRDNTKARKLTVVFPNRVNHNWFQPSYKISDLTKIKGKQSPESKKKKSLIFSCILSLKNSKKKRSEATRNILCTRGLNDPA